VWGQKRSAERFQARAPQGETNRRVIDRGLFPSTKTHGQEGLTRRVWTLSAIVLILAEPPSELTQGKICMETSKRFENQKDTTWFEFLMTAGWIGMNIHSMTFGLRSFVRRRKTAIFPRKQESIRGKLTDRP
jgi:hypothetical protein